MEVKLKTKKRNVVVSDSDQEEGGEQDVDLDALLALANAAVIVDSNIPPGGASSSHIPTDVPIGVALLMEDDNLVRSCKGLLMKNQAHVDRLSVEAKTKRQQEVLTSALYYTEADWINIMAQVEANVSLSQERPVG
ncbi:hypothetical protein Tco_0488252 [Tanacetum coccineum]